MQYVPAGSRLIWAALAALVQLGKALQASYGQRHCLTMAQGAVSIAMASRYRGDSNLALVFG